MRFSQTVQVEACDNCQWLVILHLSPFSDANAAIKLLRVVIQDWPKEILAVYKHL
jgi:hypothetical protein